MMGEKIEPEKKDSKLILTITDLPIYVVEE